MKIRKFRRYILFTSILILYSILILTGLYYISIQQDDGVRINLAGRQRMLSQKLAKEILLYRIGEISQDSIKKTIAIFTSTQDALISGGPAPLDIESNAFRTLNITSDNASLRKFIEVKNEWDTIHSNINIFLLKKDVVSLKNIISRNEILLKKIDDSVYTLQLTSEKNNLIIRVIIIFSFLIISSMLLVSLIKRIKKLKIAESRINELETLLPICSNCKKIRTDNDKPMESDSWITIEDYLHNKKDMLFTHSICPDCIKKLYPGMIDGMKK